MEILIATGLTLLLVILNALIDASKIKRGVPIYHGVNNAVRLAYIVSVGLLVTDGMLPLVKTIVYCGAVFWLLFDYALNEARRINGEKWIHWWYVGNGAWTDRILGDQHGYTYRYTRLFVLKLLPLTVVVIWILKC